MAPIFSSFEPRPKRVFTPLTKKTWKGAINEGVRALSRTSFNDVSARSNSKSPKSRESGATRCSRTASRQRLRKKASSPTSTYAGFSLRDSSSEKKRSAWLKARTLSFSNRGTLRARCCGGAPCGDCCCAGEHNVHPLRAWDDRVLESCGLIGFQDVGY